jgi:DNA-binding SARP family transcriptional activator/pimeloyl-ACP methyl ester carboxylesterase
LSGSSPYGGGVRVDVLGPLRVEADRGEVELPAAKERSLVAALALRPRAAVSTDELVAALWGDQPPASARKTLQTYVSNVRRALGPGLIVTRPPGYALDIDPDDVDAVRFRRLVREGEEARRSGAGEGALAALRSAVGLWRGEAFGEVASHTGLANEGVRLREEYLSALEARVSVELDQGLHGEIVGELEGLARAHPFRERLWAELMLAQYRCGRQADALATYQRARALLTEELGLEPGGELRRMEAAILAQDPALAAGPSGSRSATATATAPTTATAPPTLDRSPVRYALTDDGVHIAYQVIGSGPVDILVIPGFVTHLDLWWDAPTDHLVRRLASFGRLILFDKRGMGLSDRPAKVEADRWVEDARAVLDAVASSRAVIFGISAGVPTAVLFAARHPSRTRLLALYGGYARLLIGDDCPDGITPAMLDLFVDDLEARWGTGAGMRTYAPSLRHDPVARDFWARYQRISASPGAAATFLRALAEADVRAELPRISAPTLVLHPARDASVPVVLARAMAAAIPGARFVELDSDIHLIWLSDVIDDITNELDAFIQERGGVAGTRRALVTLLATGSSATDAAEVAEVAVRHGGSGLPGGGVAFETTPGDALRCAVELARTGVRVGVHTGECEIADGEVTGLPIAVARGAASLAAAGEVVVTRTVRDLTLGSTFTYVPRGSATFDGVPGEWDMLMVRITEEG